MSVEPLRVACVGMGWWSDVLADAIKRSGKLKIVALLSRARRRSARRSPRSTAASAAASYEAILEDRVDRGDHQHHAEQRASRDDARRGARRASTCSSTSRSPTRSRTRARITRRVPRGGCRARARLSAPARGSQFRWIRKQIDDGVFGRLVNAEANISRDRLGKIDLGSWRYTAEGMPGGVMLQIGIHYIDVLEYLIGPVKAVSGSLAQLVLPGDNPDVASLILEHENGALSTLNASYASASEYYVMNVYGKEASAYYDLHQGLALPQARQPSARSRSRSRRSMRSSTSSRSSPRRCAGRASRRWTASAATASLAVIRAGIKSAREGRRVEVAESAGGRECANEEGADERHEHEVLLLAWVARARVGLAQEPPFPQRGNVEITVLFPAGTSADVTARLLAEGMAKHLGADRARREPPGRRRRDRLQARRQPEARRLLRWCGTRTRSRRPTTRASSAFDYRAFDPVARVLVESPVLAVRGDAQWKTLGDFLADAKARPGKITVGELGHRQPHAHLVGRALQGRAASKVVDVPYARGAGRAEPARRARRCDGAAARRARGAACKRETVRMLATMIPRRDPTLPDVPTAQEQGVDVVARGLARHRGAARARRGRRSPRSKTRSVKTVESAGVRAAPPRSSACGRRSCRQRSSAS